MKKPKISNLIGVMIIVMDVWKLRKAKEAKEVKKVAKAAKKVMEEIPSHQHSFKNPNAIQNVLNAKHVLIVGAK